MAVMSEAVAGVVATLIEARGCDTNSRLTYSAIIGNIQSIGDVRGTYAGGTAEVRISSFFDVFFDLAYGGVASGVDFNGDGRAALSDGRDIMIMTAAGGSIAFPWDVHVIKNYKQAQVSAGIQIKDDGLVVITRSGRPIAKYKQTSVFQRYPPFRRTLKKTRIAPTPGCIASFTETISPAGDSITGKVVVKIP